LIGARAMQQSGAQHAVRGNGPAIALRRTTHQQAALPAKVHIQGNRLRPYPQCGIDRGGLFRAPGASLCNAVAGATRSAVPLLGSGFV
jgi:hypothetical protein